jgi:Mn-dependent DtxR family transcriptional regulator
MGEMAPFAVNKLMMKCAEVARRMSVSPSATTKSVARGRDDNLVKEIQKTCFKV